MKSKIFIFFVMLVLFTSGCIEMDMLGSDTMTKQERAVETGEPSICEDASNPDACFMAVAKSKGDANICERIWNNGMRENCKNSISSS